MRESTLLFFLLVAGCGSGPGGEVIEDLRGRSRALACEPLALDRELAITALRTTSDTSWAVLDEAQRLVIGYDDRARPLWIVHLEPDGPLALPTPVGMAAAGDTLVHVVDRGRFTLASLDTRTGLGRSFRLDFLPGGVTALPGGGAAVTSLPMGARPRELLFILDGDTLRPVDVPQRAYADLSVNALGNMVVSEADAEGTLLVVHQFLAPRAFRVEADGEVRALSPPVPDGTAHKREYIPSPPVTPDALPHLYIGAAALSVDRGAGEVYMLTQTGHREEDRSERAILRLDPSLRYLGSYLLDARINAGHIAYLARRRAFVVADDVDGVHLCPLPGSTPDDAPAQ